MLGQVFHTRFVFASLQVHNDDLTHSILFNAVDIPAQSGVTEFQGEPTFGSEEGLAVIFEVLQVFGHGCHHLADTSLLACAEPFGIKGKFMPTFIHGRPERIGIDGLALSAGIFHHLVHDGANTLGGTRGSSYNGFNKPCQLVLFPRIEFGGGNRYRVSLHAQINKWRTGGRLSQTIPICGCCSRNFFRRKLGQGCSQLSTAVR